MEFPGIHDGDMFYYNDPFVGGIHAADQSHLMPLFYKGELYGWLGALTHTPETGAIEPGGMPQVPAALCMRAFVSRG